MPSAVVLRRCRSKVGNIMVGYLGSRTCRVLGASLHARDGLIVLRRTRSCVCLRSRFVLARTEHNESCHILVMVQSFIEQSPGLLVFL